MIPENPDTLDKPIPKQRIDDKNKILAFLVENNLYGLPLSSVERVLRIVAITPVPKAPAHVLGIINMHGSIIPVFNIRRLFGLPERETGIDEQIIITRTTRRRVALVADNVREIIELAENAIHSSDILPSLSCVNAVLKTQEGLILITDLENCLSLEEDVTCEEADQQETNKDG